MTATDFHRAYHEGLTCLRIIHQSNKLELMYPAEALATLGGVYEYVVELHDPARFLVVK